MTQACTNDTYSLSRALAPSFKPFVIEFRQLLVSDAPCSCCDDSSRVEEGPAEDRLLGSSSVKEGPAEDRLIGSSSVEELREDDSLMEDSLSDGLVERRRELREDPGDSAPTFL